MGDGRERVGGARGRFGRVLAPGPVDLVELLGLHVVGLHVLVGDRPRGRDPAVVAHLPEVLLAQAIERCAVELRRAADVVVNLRLKGLAAPVVPSVRRDIAIVLEHVLRRPVLGLARKPVPTLEQQDPLPRRREVSRERAAAGPRADDDDVVALGHHTSSWRRSARMIRAAASSSARCENACGKFPRCRPVLVSNSSAYRPSGEAMLSSFSIRSRARCCSPMIASPETSQNEQIRKLPSLPDMPSSVSSVR